MPYCYLLPYVFHVHVLLFGYYYQLVSNSQQRFKRHILPTDHITVHSFNSNISIANWVVVHSDTSKVQFREKFLRGEIWSDYSKLEFQPHGQEENFTAQSNILTIFKLSKLMLQTTCEQIQMSLKANRSADGHSYLQYRADQNVKLILSKGVTRVNVINGEWAHIAAATSNLRVLDQTIISSKILNNFNRQLHIESMSNNSSINITIFNAQMQMEYGNMSIQIAPDYRFLRIKSGLYIVNLRTNVSAFKISITDHVMAVNCESELTQIQIYPNSSNIIITTDQYSRMVLDKGSKSVVLGGEKIQSVGNINIVSMQLNILLKSGDISFIQASANHSLITMQESSTNMALKASHHDMDIIGGKTNLHLFTGNISIDITANADLESLPTMLALFSTPDDNFEDIGPIIDSINGFTIPSKIYSNTTLQSPTLVSQTISDKANSSEFEIIKLQNKSSLENTPDVFSTFDFLFEITTSTTIFEYSTLTIPFQKTTLWLSNFTESSTLLHYEKTSQIGDEDIMTSVDQKNATEITAITADEPYLSVQNSMTSITSSPNISSTISFNYSMISTSQIISNVSQPLIVVPSTTLSNIEVTVQSIIPLIPVTTFISTEITRTVITDIPPTFGTEQMSTSTASTTHLISDNSSREEYSAGGTWPMDNDSSTNNTEFISTTSIKAIIPTTLTTLTSQSEKTTRSTTCIEVVPLVTLKSEATMESVTVKTDRSIGSAWTAFSSPPFEFPSSKRPLPTASLRKGNFILHNSAAKSDINAGIKRIWKDGKEASENSTIFMPVIKKALRGSLENKKQLHAENQKTKSLQKQNFSSSSKLKRSLFSDFENEKIYEVQLKIPSDKNLTTDELHRKLFLALQDFEHFPDLQKQQPNMNKNAINVKIKNINGSDNHLQVLYSVFFDNKQIPCTTNLYNMVNKTNDCARNYKLIGANLSTFALIGLLRYFLVILQ